jgi:hypothetical protein
MDTASAIEAGHDGPEGPALGARSWLDLFICLKAKRAADWGNICDAPALGFRRQKISRPEP